MLLPFLWPSLPSSLLLVSLPSPSFLPLEIGVWLTHRSLYVFHVCILMPVWTSFCLWVSHVPSCLFLGGGTHSRVLGLSLVGSWEITSEHWEFQDQSGCFEGNKGGKKVYGASRGRERGPSEG